jgi:hypothetical protein
MLALPEEGASQKIVSLSAAVWWERKRQGSKRREGCKGMEEICCIFPINFLRFCVQILRAKIKCDYG